MIKKLDSEGVKFIENMYKGHPDCQFPIGANVIKIRNDKSDVHSAGTEGIVKGSFKLKSMPEEAYMVRFRGDTQDVFISGSAISLDLTIKEVKV